MTGALCVIGAGTVAQPLLATLVQLFFLLLVLKLAPYEEDKDDWASMIASITLVLTMLCGFAIMSDESAGDDAQFGDSGAVGTVLVLLSGTCTGSVLVIALLSVERSHCSSMYRCIHRCIHRWMPCKCCKCCSKISSAASPMKVLPMNQVSEGTLHIVPKVPKPRRRPPPPPPPGIAPALKM